MLVLKIILKIILILLLVILILLAVLLLMRLKYSVTAKYDEAVEARAECSLLFGLIRVLYQYGGEDAGLTLKLPFGIGQKKKKDETADISYSDEEKPFTEFPEEKPPEPEPEKPEEPKEDNQPAPKEEQPEVKKPKADEKSKAEKKPKKQKAEKPKKQKKESFIDKIKNGYDTFNRFRERYDIPLLLHNIRIFIAEQIRSIGIMGGSLNGILGLGDPSQTGMALGGLGIARALTPVEIDVDGNFEKKQIALEGNIYGKTYLLKLALPALKLIFKKPVRTIITDILFKKG